jgi:hypothetical protein
MIVAKTVAQTQRLLNITAAPTAQSTTVLLSGQELAA